MIGNAPATKHAQPMGSDFSPEYIAFLRRMSGEEKLRAAFQLYRAARTLKAAAIRDRHPDWSEERVRQEVKEIFLHARS